MPVPESYSRRYGREETTYSSTYSTSRGTRSSYLSSYSTSKQSTSLPPRPPSLYGSDAYRKYDTSSVTSRYLNSTTGTGSRLRDYGSPSGTGATGSSYRTSVSPVRATSALRTSLADRLKAMEIDSKDDDLPVRTSYASRYTPLRSREPLTSTISSRAYTSTYGNRDRSNSREYGVSPLAGTSSNLSSSHRERDSSATRNSSENLKKRGSPSPTSSVSNSRKDSADSGLPVANGQSSTEVNKTSSSSSSTSESATCVSKGVATHIAITTTSQKPLVTTSCATTTISDTTDNSVVIVDSNNSSVDVGTDDANGVSATTVIVSDSSSCAYRCDRDLENNDVNGSSHSPPGTISLRIGSELTATNIAISHDEGIVTPSSCNSNTKSLGMVKKMSNGNSSDDDGGSNKDSNGVLVMVVQDRISKKVKSVPSSSSNLKDSGVGVSASSSATLVVDASTGGGDQALGSSSSLSSASDSVFPSPSIVKVMEKDSNGNPISMDAKAVIDESPAGAGAKSKYGKTEEKETARTTSSAVKVAVTRRRRESDSNANNLVETVGNGKEERSTIDDGHKISIKVNRESSPSETYTVSKPRRSATLPSSSSALSTSRSRVIYHTIKVEDATTKSPSPEPVTYTVKAPSSTSSSTSTSDNKKTESTKVSTDTTAEFKVSLPRRRSSVVKPDLPSSSASGANDNRHRNGNMEPRETAEELNNQKKSNSRETESPSKSSVMNQSVRSNRKSASPGNVKVVTNHHTSSLKNEEDSSSSVDDEQSEYEKRVKRNASVGTSTTQLSKSSVPAAASSTARKSKSKSPAPRSSKRAEASPPSKHASEDVANVNGSEMGGPHTSKFAYEPSQTEHSPGTNRNDRSSRYGHLSGATAVASDSSDNVS